MSATGDQKMLQRANLYAHHVCEEVCSKNRVEFVVRNKVGGVVRTYIRYRCDVTAFKMSKVQHLTFNILRTMIIKGCRKNRVKFVLKNKGCEKLYNL